MDRDVQQDIKAMMDSFHLIEDIIKADKHDEQLDDDVRRNYKHLEIMMDKDWIKESGHDLGAFIACVARAKTWLGE